MLENADLSQPKLVTGFCQLVKLLQQGQRELKLDNFFFFFGNCFRWNLISFYFKKLCKPLSKIPLLVVKRNRRDSIYTIIFQFVGEVGCQKTEHWF